MRVNYTQNLKDLTQILCVFSILLYFSTFLITQIKFLSCFTILGFYKHSQCSKQFYRVYIAPTKPPQ